MNPIELYWKDGSSADVWYCSKCRTIAKGMKAAEACCQPPICRHCKEPVYENGWTIHAQCAAKARIEDAKKLEVWDGWVYLEGFDEEYFASLSVLRREAFYRKKNLPEYVFICNPIQFRAPRVEDILERCLDDHYDDAYEAIDSKSYFELQAALTAFEKANSHIVSYEPDYKTMVRVKGEEK